MRLEYLYYFKHLAEVLNFTKAAQDLFIAQPTLSTAIKRMERELDFPLFDRDGNKVVLTPQGEAFYENIVSMLASYERGIMLAQECEGKMSKHLRVGAINPIQSHSFAKAILEFKKTCTETPHILVDHGYTYELTEKLRKGELDVIFGSKLPNSDDLDYQLFWSQPLVAAVNVMNPLAQRDRISLSDLANYYVITYRDDVTPDCDLIKALADKNELTLSYHYDQEINMASVIISDAEQVALLYYSFLMNAFDNIKCISIDGVPLDFHKIYMVTRRERHPKLLQNFIDFMNRYHLPENLGPNNQ